jgi:bifunctional non-homologous end joining protein LigD
MARKRQSVERAQHAMVGGWSQRKGRFTGLLLGIRQGKRRKLTYVGEAPTTSDVLVMRFLEDRLREAEIEISPFLDEPPVRPDTTHHWISPELVAEVEHDGWSKGRIKGAMLQSVTERTSFRHPRWIEPPAGAAP